MRFRIASLIDLCFIFIAFNKHDLLSKQHNLTKRSFRHHFADLVQRAAPFGQQSQDVAVLHGLSVDGLASSFLCSVPVSHALSSPLHHTAQWPTTLTRGEGAVAAVVPPSAGIITVTHAPATSHPAKQPSSQVAT